MSENSIKVLTFLQTAGTGQLFTLNQIKDALSLDSARVVSGIILSFQRKGLIEWTTEEVELDGKTKIVRYVSLTQDGANYKK